MALKKKNQSDDVQSNRDAVLEAERTKTSHTSEDRQNQGTIPMPTFATRPLTTSSTILVELPQNYMVGQQRQRKSELQFDQFHDPHYFSDFPSDAVLWIKEVEMVDSLDELKSSRSVYGKDFPNFEMLDARKSASRNSKPRKRTGFYEEDRSLS